MTNREAVIRLEEQKEKYLNNYIDFAGIEDAYDMAIEALKAESWEDAISRQAVLEIQAKYSKYIGATKFWQMRDDIKALPFVTPQLKAGRWVILRDEYGDVTEAVCSCCDKNGNHKWAFCPNCGARMEN